MEPFHWSIEPKQAKPFFDYAVARETIRLSRANGQPGPWINDPILSRYRFCNVFREDDKVTQWVKKNVRDPLSDVSSVITALTACRFFNRIETLERIKDILVDDPANIKAIKKALKGVKPVVTAAYIIKAPTGMKKLDGVCWIIQQMAKAQKKICRGMMLETTKQGGCSLQNTHALLKEVPFMGNFTSYEVVTDLRHTKFMGVPLDIDTWACAGPGAARGLSRIVFGELGHFNYHSDNDQVQLNAGMQKLLKLAQGNGNLWPLEWPTWEMREVEHTLCEFDKYERARLGQGRPKQIYRICENT